MGYADEFADVAQWETFGAEQLGYFTSGGYRGTGRFVGGGDRRLNGSQQIGYAGGRRYDDVEAAAVVFVDVEHRGDGSRLNREEPPPKQGSYVLFRLSGVVDVQLIPAHSTGSLDRATDT